MGKIGDTSHDSGYKNDQQFVFFDDSSIQILTTDDSNGEIYLDNIWLGEIYTTPEKNNFG